MENEIHTLQEFYAYTKGVIYLLIPVILLGMVGFWTFLTDRDND
jgi:hypothetical protein